MAEVTADFAIKYLLDDCDDCPENKDGECMTQSHCFEVKYLAIKALRQVPKTGHCKDCKYFEYDSVANVDGIPLIVAHEICSRWGDGCKTKEDGYCFMFEPQESEVKCHTCKHYTSGENDGSCGSYICKGYSNWESEG